jgi:Lipid desaturase domain
MENIALPNQSKVTVITCIAMQIFALYSVANYEHHSLLLVIIAFFISGFLTDLISGLAHFSFDYVWPDNMPILGPISVEFRAHHDKPTLDPSAILTNLTKGAYAALPVAIITCILAKISADTMSSFLIVATLMGISFWMLGFHQIHSYAHMGSRLSPEKFNQAVVRISQLPTKKQQTKAFAKLFQSVDIPPSVRLLQRCGLFLRPEIHWQHHITFDSDFSSVNGWSDPVMNWLYRPLARRKKLTRQN